MDYMRNSDFGPTSGSNPWKDPLQEMAGGSLADLEKKIRERNERFRRLLGSPELPKALS